jgi:hypothetical protein
VLLEKMDKFALELEKPLRCLLFNPASRFYPLAIDGISFHFIGFLSSFSP